MEKGYEYRLGVQVVRLQMLADNVSVRKLKGGSAASPQRLRLRLVQNAPRVILSADD